MRINEVKGAGFSIDNNMGLKCREIQRLFWTKLCGKENTTSDGSDEY